MQRRKRDKLVDLILIAAVVLGVTRLRSYAEALGTVEGTVVTAGGGAISGASVSVDGDHVHRTASTDGSGHFSIGGLAAGNYTLTAAAPGYTAARAPVAILAGVTATVKLSLAAQPKTEVPKADEKKPDPKPAEMPSLAPPPPARHAVGKPGPAYLRGSAPSPVARPPIARQPLDQRDPSMNTEQYARIDDNPFFRTQVRPLSTFSVDVDTASYSNTRRFLKEGKLPPKDAVRIEELINYFHFDYPAPPKDQPFSITTEIGPSPWNPKLQLARIGLKAPPIDDAKVPARNLVFLIDVSGSMDEPNKLPLLKRALGLLVEQIRAQDKIAMVVYAGNSGLVLPSTTGNEKDPIRAALANLEAGGSTNGGAGIQLAYQVAQKSFIKNGINRVILCTDGDFNVGMTSEGDLTRLIEQKRENGVFLTVLGFGMGNLKDSTMEKLADRGNGNYAYIDSIEEARKVLVKEAGATLVTVAKDVKLQVEFNPTTVAGYRLIGYENRLLRDEDFNDDKKDAGDIGAGHSVTALYELVPAGVDLPGAKVDALKYQTTHTPTAAATSDELMTVKIRYKAPDGKTSKLLSQAVKADQRELAKTSVDFRWAAAIAGFGMILRESPLRGTLNWAQVASLAEGALGSDTEGYRKEFVKLLALAQKATR
jgi:Ca-activated chloride channel family protein